MTMHLDKINRDVDELRKEFSQNYLRFDDDSRRIVFNDKIINLASSNIVIKDIYESKLKLLINKRNLKVVVFDQPYFIKSLECKATSNLVSEYNHVHIFQDYTKEMRSILLSPIENSVNTTSLTEDNNYIAEIGFKTSFLVLPEYFELGYVNVIHFESEFDAVEFVSDVCVKLVDIENYISEISNDLLKSLNNDVKKLDEYENKIKISKEYSDKLGKEISFLEEKRDDYNSTINSLNSELSKGQQELSSVRQRLAQSQNELEAVRAHKDELSRLIESDSIQTEQISKKYENLQKEVDALAIQKEKLDSDINITSYNMAGFSKEARDQRDWYFIISIGLMGFLFVVFTVICYNAESFKDLVVQSNVVSPFNILIGRLPLIMATFLIVGSLSALLIAMIKIAVSLNEQKMNMLKASILVEHILPKQETQGLDKDLIRAEKTAARIEVLERIFNTKKGVITNSATIDELSKLLQTFKDIKK
ncbi:hypothetical protein [Shewanella algae]|uniref:hypothetical protein n=1 Tax=Shewanella algae TaxID=38313 RepID=UPI0031F58EF7